MEQRDKNIVQAILTERCFKAYSLERICETYKGIRDNGIEPIPAAIITEQAAGRLERNREMILDDYNYFLERYGDPIVADLLARAIDRTAYARPDIRRKNIQEFYERLKKIIEKIEE